MDNSKAMRIRAQTSEPGSVSSRASSEEKFHPEEETTVLEEEPSVPEEETTVPKKGPSAPEEKYAGTGRNLTDTEEELVAPEEESPMLEEEAITPEGKATTTKQELNVPEKEPTTPEAQQHTIVTENIDTSVSDQHTIVKETRDDKPDWSSWGGFQTGDDKTQGIAAPVGDSLMEDLLPAKEDIHADSQSEATVRGTPTSQTIPQPTIIKKGEAEDKAFGTGDNGPKDEDRGPTARYQAMQPSIALEDLEGLQALRVATDNQQEEPFQPSIEVEDVLEPNSNSAPHIMDWRKLPLYIERYLGLTYI